jgi:hypothetical protein
MSVPALILLVLTLVEVIAVTRVHLELVAAAREGARVAATVPDPGRAVTAVERALGDPLGPRVQVSVSRPRMVGRPATVEVALRHHLVTPLLRSISLDLRARAVMLVEK